MPFLDELNQLKEKNLHRSLRRIDSPQGPVVECGGRELLNFSSNDYLGLAFDPRLVRASQDTAARWGTGSGASRLICGSLEIHHALEEKTAAYKREEAALVFTSGFTANLAAVTALAGAGDSVWIDRFSHASIVDAARLSGARLRVFPHLDLDFLDRCLAAERPPKSAAGRCRNVVVTDTYFSMDGDTVDLAALVRICRARGALLVLDEAHATGVMGKTGRGLTEEAGVEGKADIVMGTFSKAFGSQGGFLAGKKEIIELVVNRARSFIYTTGPAPAASGASLAALEIAAEDAPLRKRLWKNTELLRSLLERAGFDLAGSTGPIVPVLIGDTKRALDISNRLLEGGILVPAIRPPTVSKGTDRLRVTVTAKHTEQQIGQLVDALRVNVGRRT